MELIKKMLQRMTRFLTVVIIALFAQTLKGQTVTLKNWIAEDHSGQMRISVSRDTFEIVSPKGVTLWYNQKLTGEYEISYRVQVVMQGGPFDRLSDLNCFWAANDPEHPNNLFARSAWRNGIFQHYKTLNLFYVGYGGNHNTTTRFRRYYGTGADSKDEIARPIIKEYTDLEHLLQPNRWYGIRIVVKEDATAFYVDDDLLFQAPLDRAGEGDGYFGLRLLTNHVIFSDFKVSN